LVTRTVWRFVVAVTRAYGALCILSADLVLLIIGSQDPLFQALWIASGVATILYFLALAFLIYRLGWWALFATRSEILDAMEIEDEEEEDRRPRGLGRGVLSSREVVAASDRADGHRTNGP
jgi:hypothetical protein